MSLRAGVVLGWAAAWAWAWGMVCVCGAAPGAGPGVGAEIEVEEELYRYEPADNGAGPMWCHGSSCVVRVGEVVYATGLETLPGVKPLNNCRWVLWRRDAAGWVRWVEDGVGRTREPSPLAVFPDGRVWVSGNPTLNAPDREGGGPARPELREVTGGSPGGTRPEVRVEWPGWQGEPRFTEHSYRSLAADGPGRELVMFQNIDNGHAEWAFRGADGRWSAQGRLKWPWGADYAKPQPVRICYPNVALRARAVHFLGVSDILEPNPEWRAFKQALTGKQWDYDFRRLFYTHTPDITREPFRDWIEVASRESTGGGISSADLSVEPDGSVWILWTERGLDERLRAKFFPDAKQFQALRLARIRGGNVFGQRTLVESTEDRPGPVAEAARFHRDGQGRLWVIRAMGGAGPRGNDLVLLDAEGRPGVPVRLPFARPFTSFFTATPRAGSASGEVIDLLGVREGTGHAIGYARVRLRMGQETGPGERSVER